MLVDVGIDENPPYYLFLGAGIAENPLFVSVCNLFVGAGIAEHPLYYLFVGAGIAEHPPLDPDIVYEVLVAGVVPQ